MGADPEQIEAARRQVGSDLPVSEQFVRFVSSLARFDFGNSFISGAPVLAEIGKRLTVTVPLTLLAFVLAIVIALPLGIIAAVKQDRWYGVLLSVVSQLGIAVPVFWIGILLVAVFRGQTTALSLRRLSVARLDECAGGVSCACLAVITIALVMSSSLIRYVRSATQDVLGSDYLRTARALVPVFRKR
nr:ABC transporter permease [Rhizobium sp. ACO-34A]